VRRVALVARFAIAALGAAVLAFFVTFRTFRVASASMSPSLHTGDVVLANMLVYRAVSPRAGDVVVHAAPMASATLVLKRILAVPGDTFSIGGGVVRRNGTIVPEPYLSQATSYRFAIARKTFIVDGTALDTRDANLLAAEAWTSPDAVPRGCYLVFGDDRSNSVDSHLFGCAQTDGVFVSGPAAGRAGFVAGRVVRIVYPFDRAGGLP